MSIFKSKLPFVNAFNRDACEQYETAQLADCAAVNVAYHGYQSDANDVVDALVGTGVGGVLIKNDRQNRIIAASHGWTLDELAWHLFNGVEANA